MPGLLQTVPQFTLEANVGNFPKATVIGTGTVAILRITIRIGIANAQDEREIDFVLQSAHLGFLSEKFLANSVGDFGLAIGARSLLVRIRRRPEILALRVVAEQELAT